MRPDRILRRDGVLELALVGERELGDVSEAARFGGGGDPRITEFLPVERRALEEIGELLAVREIVEHELLVPRAGLDLGCEHHSAGGRYSIASSAFDAMRKPSGFSSSSARWARRLAVRARIGTARTEAEGKPMSSMTAAIAMETLSVSGFPQVSATACRSARASAMCEPLDAALVCELQDPLGSGVDRLVHGMAEPRHLAACCVHLSGRGVRDSGGRATRRDHRLHLFEKLRARSGRPEHDRARAENPGCNRSLQRVRSRRERHPGGHVRRHHPVLGERDEHEVEEEALLFRRLPPGEEQVEVLGERHLRPSGRLRGRGHAPRRDPGTPGSGA